MAYANPIDLVIAFGAQELAEVSTPKRFDIVDATRLELAIETPTFADGEADETVLRACLYAINAAIGIADSIVDSYLSTRYTLPLASTPVSLKKRTLDLARFELQVEAATEETRNRRNDAIKWLETIAAGKAKIGDSTIDAGAGSSSGIQAASTGTQKFSNASDNAAFSGYGI